MDVSRVSLIHQAMTQQIQSQQQLQKVDQNKSSISFSDIFEQQLQETNNLQYQADTELQSFMLGESDNIHDVMIAMEEATIALELTTQVRNKIVEAYQEIKNMQI